MNRSAAARSGRSTLLQLAVALGLLASTACAEQAAPLTQAPVTANVAPGQTRPADPATPTTQGRAAPEPAAAASPGAPIIVVAPTAEPRPVEPVAMVEARQRLAEGRYQAAVEQWRAVLESVELTAGQRTEVQLRLAESLARADQGAEALEVLSGLASSSGAGAYLRGLALVATGQHAEAMASMARAVEREPTLAASVWLEVAEREMEARRPAEAAEATARGLETAETRPLRTRLLEVRSQALRALDAPEEAFEADRQILALAPTTSQLGEQLYRLALASRDLGKREEAIRALTTAIEDFPAARTTADALRLLDALGAEDAVDPYLLGVARYYALDFRNAVEAFDRYLAAEPDGLDADSARMFRALATLTPGNEIGALRELDAIANAPGQETELAAQALLEGGQALERIGRLEEAARRYQSLLDQYPRLDEAAPAAFRLGLLAYLQGDYTRALDTWDTVIARAEDVGREDVGRAYYWRGKALGASNQEAAAQAAWREAVQTAPGSYYGLRAAENLGQIGPGGDAAADPAITSAEEEALAAWLKQHGQDLAAARALVEQDASVARARLLAEAGLTRQGSWEAEALAQRYFDRADRLYAAARVFQSLNLHGGATRLAQAAMSALSEDDAAAAPVALKKAAYPRPFADLLNVTAERYGLDPLALDALFLEASGFDPSAISQASRAAGLGMTSPVHVEEAARALGLSGGDAALSVPRIAVEMEAWLLADRLRRFSGRTDAAIGALDHGERPMDAWIAREGADDPDVLLERMDWEGSRATQRATLASLYQYHAIYALPAATTEASVLAARQIRPDPTDPAVKIARLYPALPPAAPFSPPPAVGSEQERAAFAAGATFQRDGNHAAAVEVFAPLVQSVDAAVASAARLNLGQALLGAGRATEALGTLEQAHAAAPGSLATFLYGRALAETDQCEAAIPRFEQFAQQQSGGLGVQGRAALADCLVHLGRPAEAVDHFVFAAGTDGLPRLQVIAFEERAALARVRASDTAGARAAYAALLETARSATYRAELNYYLGVLSDTPEAALQRFRAALQTAPQSPGAQAALDELVSLGDPAAYSFEAGETRFGQNRYYEALTAYEAVLAATPTGQRAALARYGRGVSLVRLNQDQPGIQALQEIASFHPGTEDAADGLFRAGRVLESVAELEAAASSYEAVLRLPNGGGARAFDAQFRLGFVAYRQGDPARALDLWRDLSGRAGTAEYRAQAGFWVGKALQEQGDSAGARAAWQSAMQVDPGGYYSLRAGDYLAGGAWLTPRADLERSLAIVQQAPPGVLNQEMRGWLTSRGANVAAAEARLLAAPSLQRAETLLAMGLRREATWELEALAGRLAGDVARLGLLAAWEHERALYNPAMVLGFSLAGNANVSLRTGPAAVRMLVNPIPHPAALAQVGREQQVDPLLFSALMRQESAMDQYVESAAQARGLTQVIASTAYEAAQALGLYNFTTTDLFRPRTSLTIGGYTFARRLDRYDQRIFPSLAAYNANQFSVDGWLLATGEADIDTFAEAIPFTETYPYVQTIYENYRQYLDLYR